MTDPRAPHVSVAGQGHCARRSVAPVDPGGPVVAVCVGHRCAALRALSGSAAAVGHLAAGVRATPGAVLVTSGCLGGCAHGALAGVGRRDGATGSAGPTVWLTCVHEPSRAAALAAWVVEGGPPVTGEPDAGLPVPLVDAVAGIGPPVRFGG